MMLRFCLFALLVVAAIALECPPRSSERPSALQLTTSNGLCGYTAYVQPNEHNDSYLDIYLEANEIGWVAIGFSQDQKMANSDVVGCKHNSSGGINVFNTWNGQHPPNVINPSQDGMCQYESSYENGRLSCWFSRYHGVINPGYDYDLDDEYYFLLGCSKNQNDNQSEGFPYHDPNTPQATNEKYNAFTYRGAAKSKPNFEKRMIKAHGILMVIAYPVLMVSGVFFAAWMKPTLPKLWFQFHRAIMMTSLGIALVAFMIIFIANKDNPTPGIINLKDCGAKTTHFVFGIAAVALHLVNPILGLIRCKPESPHRWIFNIIHGGGIGLLTEFIALTNIALGAVIFQSNCNRLDSSNIMLYLYLSWCAVLISIQVFLYIYFTVKAFKGDVEGAPMLVKIYFKFFHNSNYVTINEDTNEDTSKSEAKVRYSVFAFQFGLTLIIAIIMTIFIAVDNFK